MTRDESLIRFAAEKVMGWREIKHLEVSYSSGKFESGWCGDGSLQCWARDWNPLESWADAGMLWEKARKSGMYLGLACYVILLDGQPGFTWIGYQVNVEDSYNYADSGPRAIVEAICRSYGWAEEGGAA